MSDWIKQWKENDDKAQGQRRTEIEAKLLRAKKTTAKGRLFWQQLMVCFKNDTEEIKATFPDNRTRNCEFSMQGEACTLHGHANPAKTLVLSLNLDAEQIDAKWTKRLSSGQETKDAESLSFHLNESDEVYVSESLRVYTSANELSEHLLKLVCVVGA